MTCVIYLPLSRLQNSPYADIASPSLHFDLEPLFAKEYCASLGMSRQVPLRVVGDIGGGGALARIEKGRKVMRERKSEWSQTDELPVSCASLYDRSWIILLIHKFTIDRNSLEPRESISSNICMSRVQGTIDGAEPADDDGLRSCPHER